MLHDNLGRIGGMDSAKQQAECKPDYEKMIAAARKQLNRATALIEAVFEYTGNRILQGKLAEMVGELVSEERMFEKRIEEMIAEQEKD